jgi:hypothetical protein
MRAEQTQRFALPASEQLTIPELGGDGIVTVVGLGFGEKMAICRDPRETFRAALLTEAAVLDDDGNRVMSAEGWDAFGIQHEAQYIKLLEVVRRLSGFDAVAVKKS